MFVKGELSKERELKRRKKYLKGKNVKQKFSNLLVDTLTLLKEIRPYMSHLEDTYENKLNTLINEHEQSKQTTKDERALDGLIMCYDDLAQLKEDMQHAQHKQTHADRLLKILTFLRDFHTVAYIPEETGYDEKTSNLGKQIEKVAKTFHYKAAKLQSEMEKKESEMLYLENTNKSYAESLDASNNQSVAYKNTASKIKANHKTITALKSHLNTLSKNHSIMENFAQMFEQLAINEAYHANLQSEGPIKKLLNKIERNPDSLNILEDTSKLAESLKAMKEELAEIESIIDPAQKMAFDSDDDIEEDLIAQYQNMNKS